MRIAISAFVCLVLTSASARAQMIDAAHAAESAEVSSTPPSMVMPALASQYETGETVAITGLVIFLVGVALGPFTALANAFEPASFEPVLGSAIAVASVGLVLDITGAVVMLDALLHRPVIHDAIFPM